VQTIYVLASDGTEPPTDAGDLVLDASGILHLYNGNANPDPFLSSFSPATGTWEHHAFLDWDGANRGLATTGNYVFASDRKFTSGEPADANGLVRFDLANTFAAERFAQGTDYRDVTVGFDGLVYGSNQNGLSTTVGIYDPDTLAQLGSMTLVEPVRGLAVNALGQVFGAGDEIYRFNPDGSVAASIDPGVGLLFDIDLDRSGRIVASAGDQDIVLTTEALDSFTTFSTGSFNFNDLNVAWVQEPPVTILQSADFESGDTSAWDRAFGDYSGLLDVNGAAAATGSFGLSVAVGTSCTDTTDEVVPGPTTTGLSKGCNSVSAGDVEVIVPGATFAAGQSVVLENAFSVAAGADFTAAIDPSFLTRLGYVEDTLPAPGALYNAELKVNLDSLTLDPADQIDHLVGYSPTGAEVFRATLIRNGDLSENRLVLAAELDAGPPAETPFGEQILLVPGWRSLRFAWRAAAGTGFLLVSVDGLPLVGLTDLDNDTKAMAKVRWGAPSGSIGPSTTGSLKLDDFDSWK
jgi:hypothetical protein